MSAAGRTRILLGFPISVIHWEPRLKKFITPLYIENAQSNVAYEMGR